MNHTTQINSLRLSIIDFKTINDHLKIKESPLQQSKSTIIHHQMIKIIQALLFLSLPSQYQKLKKKNRHII